MPFEDAQRTAGLRKYRPFADGLDNERVAVALGRARLFLAFSSYDAYIGLADARHPKIAAGGSSCRNIQMTR
jgi:hypothetical protein